MNSTKGIAIDIVLLPPLDVWELAISLNRHMIARTDDKKVVLGKENCIPHISLCMAGIRYEDLGKVRDIIDKIHKSLLPLEITIQGISTVTTNTGDIVSGIDIELTPPLQQFHRTVMDSLAPFALEEITPEMLFQTEERAEFIIEYIANFPKASAYSRYSPHITLGYGSIGNERDRIQLPLQFVCDTVALCHIGEYGVCSQILAHSQKKL
jgi:2'-5' RNA ligase